ncbi:uncharacterized protein LAJ45_03787 [Morchella importuna]|uniref:uncharacterized protein n=1 Tax=Morchella importuna TaxID=1174673 RepID=UPI001E8DD010|nr:uncharacterized protein LAJ45_03787 [Morchella importuna]KAH8152360.1 hypothetical protein LAJ45_03787 [Morchella importuna]
MKCPCTSLRLQSTKTHHNLSRTSSTSLDQCCNSRHKVLRSDCCSASSNIDEGVGEDDDEDYIVNIGKSGILIPWFLSLTIAGMTCTGCADKVVHVLQSMNCVLSASVKVSFLNNRAEVTFWPEFRGENEIVEILRKKTGFRVAVIGSGCIEDAGLAKVRMTICDEECPERIEKMDEVRRMRILDHENGRIILEVGYDPAIIGVRDLLRCINNNNVKFDAKIVDSPNEDMAASEAERSHLKRLGIITLVSAMLTVPVLILAWVPLPNIEMALKYTIQLPLATIVMGVAYRIYISAFRTMIYGGAGGSRIDMDVLVLVATFAAWGFSVSIFMIDTISGTFGTTGKEPFFETCCLLVALILAGRWITGMVRMWALNRVLALGDEHQRERSKRVFLVDGDNIREINEKLLQYADVLVVIKGGVIATDGVVVEGEAEVDESLLTGEAAPAEVQVGRLVMAGSNVVNGRLKYRVTRLMHENTVSVIKRMVRSAGGEKPKVQEMADRFAAIMTPTVLFISLVVFIIWLLVNRLGRNEEWSDSAVEAVSFAVATLAVSCPCAIGLAVPMVMIFASRVAMRKCGFLFVNVIAVERGLKANKVVFDKTGTLTTGKLKVVFEKEYTGVGWSAEVGDQIRNLVKTLCEGEKHPVSEALATSVSKALGHSDVTVETVVGKGLEATIEGQLVRGGQPSWCSHSGDAHHIIKEVVQQGLTVFALSIDGELRAVFGLEDTIRPEAQEVIAELHRRCIETYIFSGDHTHAVSKISKVLGIPEGNCRSGCSPEQKSSEIKKLQIQLQPTREDNRNEPVLKRPIVLFLGDGTNDAIALKQADVGLSMSDSTSVAISAADVAILSTSLTSVISFLDLMIAAGGGFVAVRISPEWAGLGELGSVLPVVIIAGFVGVRWERKMTFG